MLNKREEIVNSLSKGNVIAFKFEDRMFSGKVREVEENEVIVQTKNNSIYYVDKQDIVWVKNGSSWPKGIHNALQLTKKGFK